MSIELEIKANTESNIALTSAINALIAAMGTAPSTAKVTVSNTTKPAETQPDTNDEVDGENEEAVNTSELGKNGLPWDERIHSSAQTKTANGNWKYLRGVDTKLVAKVEAELRAKMAAGSEPEVADDEEEIEDTKATTTTQKKSKPADDDFEDDFGSDEDELGDTPDVSLADVQKAVKEITRFAKHEARLTKLLEKFGAEEVEDVGASDYAEFIEEAGKVAAFLKLQAKAQELANTSAGRDAVMKLIGKFKTAEGEKATKLGDIQFDNYGKFMELAQKQIDAAEANED